MQGNTIISGKDLLMLSLVRFYKQNNNTHMSRIIPIIEGKSNTSLRLIDWFVTNYSKKYNVIIPKKKRGISDIDNEQDHLNVYISYRQQLKAFSKQQFDPFRRRNRIKFFYNKENDWIETTIGQLNFFKWILQNNILDYIIQNTRMIEADMITSQKNTKRESDKNNKDNKDSQEKDIKENKTKDKENNENIDNININIPKKGRGRRKNTKNTINEDMKENKENKDKKNTQTKKSDQKEKKEKKSKEIKEPKKVVQKPMKPTKLKNKKESLKNFNISALLNQSNISIGPKIVKFD